MKPKLYLVNGPLGAGKTTIVKHLVQQAAFSGARLIENEFASTSVDTGQLHEHVAEIATIAGSCICCSTGDELIDALRTFANGTEPVIVEATGVANSLKIVEKLIVNDVLGLYDLAHAMFVYDAAEHSATLLQQYKDELRAADIVLVTKSDIVTTEATHRLFDDLKALGVRRSLAVIDGNIDIDTLEDSSRIVYYFAEHDGAPEAHTELPRFTVIDTVDLCAAGHEIEELWHVLHSRYSLRRMKGAWPTRSGTVIHVEATPSQCRVSESATAEDLSLVLIGADAHRVTRDVILRLLDA